MFNCRENDVSVAYRTSDVHQHFEQMTLLYWNVHSTTGCYKSVLTRYFLENDEFDCFVRESVDSGLKGVCDCMYGWLEEPGM
jgi:hypothetical protein